MTNLGVSLIKNFNTYEETITEMDYITSMHPRLKTFMSNKGAKSNFIHVCLVGFFEIEIFLQILIDSGFKHESTYIKDSVTAGIVDVWSSYIKDAYKLY